MFNNLKSLLFVFVAVNFIKIILSETAVRKCLNGQLKPLSVQVEFCTEMPCDLWRGYYSNIAIQFVATKNVLKTIKADITISTMGFRKPLQLKTERTNVCENLMFGAYCPMYEGEDATYDLVLDIPKHHPEVPANIEISLRDTSDESVLSCFILDARIRKRNCPLPNKLI